MRIWLAYRCSHRYGGALEGATEDHEQLIDADSDAHRLRRRVNLHFALPSVIDFERGNRFEIPAFALKTERMHGGGGGCSYYAWIELREAPRVTTQVCAACEGRGNVPNPDPERAGNHYFNVQCPTCKGRASV